MILSSAAPAARSTDRFGASWEGRRVLVIGLGRSGSAAARWLHQVHAHVCITEARDTEATRQAAQELRALGIEDIELGAHSRALVDGADAVIVSPGVPESAEPIHWIVERGVPLLSEVELAFRFCPSPIVAITGTNGKSTAVMLLADVLRAAGRPAIACGNVGIPFCHVLPQLTSETVAVVEVSSFQLMGCETFRPKVGVLLNIGTNHLDRHRDPAAYLEAKARLFQRQTPEDWAVLNGADPHLVALGESLRAQRVWFGDNRSNSSAFILAPQTQRALAPGAQAVLQAARILGVADPLAWQVMRAFRGLEHRMEFVGTVHGVQYVNDSKSTTPDSLLFALKRTPGPVVVILGGRDKGMDFHSVITPLHDARVKGIVLIGESRARIRPLLNGSTIVHECGSLAEAVRTAGTLAEPGTTVLFSPACASFDMFKNFEERGRAFKRVVQQL